MSEIGYTLASEEHPPKRLVELAEAAESAGFTHAMVSDHFHPWTDRQGQSPFVWSVVGGVAMATRDIRVGTAVTCPTIRIHPAIVAQAAATAACMMPGRFILGLGSGENLNEHILGNRWPSAQVRLDMLEEAIDVIRALWQGGMQSHDGVYYTVENARVYTLPDRLPPILVAAGGEKSAALAANAGDGLVGTSPESVKQYREAGGKGPTYGQLTVCWAEDEAEARRTAKEIWPNSALPGQLSQELPLPAHFEQASSVLTEDQVADAVTCGPDPEAHLAAIRTYADAGYDCVFIHQVGPDQEGFMRFYAAESCPSSERQPKDRAELPVARRRQI